MSSLRQVDPEIYRAIELERKRQQSTINLIASENYTSRAVLEALGSFLTDKYAEGYPHHRHYGGCENVDVIETLAIDRVKQLFHADHANVQPHAGAPANMAVYLAMLQYGDTIMGMDLSHGGHLTHGYRHNISSKIMQAVSYDVDPSTGLLDYSKLQDQVRREKPLILIGGYSAYPRLIDFAKMREIADSVNAVLMVDMAHFAGLVAGKVMTGNYNPIPFAHIVTSTTHKTLRGPRGGLVLCTKEFKEVVDKGCPIVLGGPLPHVMAAKAIAFKEASSPAFAVYAHRVVDNAKALAEALMKQGVRVLTNGTDNHLLVMDVMSSFGLTGRQAETVLRAAHLTVNRNSIPQDVNGPWYTSGVRLGTPAMTTLGMNKEEMREIASIIVHLLKDAKPDIQENASGPSRAKAHVDPKTLEHAQKRAAELLGRFVLYPELVIDEK